MPKSKYVSLHVHTDYSYRDSICKIKPLVARAKELGYEALAITDHGHTAGALQFYKECKKQGVKPILGVEAYIVHRTEDKDRSAHHITLLAMNSTGWENITKLLSWANEHGFYYSPRINLEQLFKHHEGIIVLSGCMQSMFAKAMVADNVDGAEKLAKEFKQVFGDRFYFEIQMVNRKGIDYIPEQNVILEETRKLSKKLGVPCVATNDVHYINKDDKLTHDIWKAISSNQTMKAPPKSKDNPRGRMVFNGEDYYIQTYKEMRERFTPKEITISVDIARRCNVELAFTPGAFMPRYDNNMSDDEVHDLLRKTCERRIREGRLFSAKDTEYVERAKKELRDIKEANLAHYFMIVDDVVSYADREGIPRGWGRGSVGGSLIAYSLGITKKIDPIKYGLIWERFYNKGRKGSMPDIDLDFCIRRRKEIIVYLREKFGNDRIYPMSTVHGLAGKMAIKDVGRALGFEFSYLNSITRFFPHKCDSITDAVERVPRLKELSEGIDKHTVEWENELKTEENGLRKNDLRQKISERRTQLKMLFQHATKLEDCKRHRSTHACALVIADRSLVGQIPLIYDTGNKVLVTAWDMYDIEDLGYLKLDVLGLKSATVIEDIRQTLAANDKDPEIEKSEQLDDPHIYKMISSGRTIGIFQLESYLGENWARRVKPRNIEEWSDIISLIRPAVLETGMADQYVKAKKSGNIECVHEMVRDIVEPTNGIMLYQEQMIYLARIVAGFSLERADVLRHAVGKKKKDEMASLKDEFIAGCQKTGGCTQEEAEKLWSLVEAGAGYGFNKAHSIEYSFLGYVMAYYKFKHPIYFYKSMFEVAASESKTREEINKLYYDALRYGIAVKAPCLDLCNPGFEIHDGTIYYGFRLIKSIGKSHMKRIGKLRNLKNTHDLRTRITEENIGRGVVLPLLYAGALDTIVSPRRRLDFAAELELFYAMTPLRQKALLRIGEKLLEEGVKDREVFKKALAAWNEQHGDKLKRNPRLKSMLRQVLSYKITSKDAMGVAEREREYLSVCMTCCEADFYRTKRTTAKHVGTVLSEYSRGSVIMLACVSNSRYIKSKKGNDVIIAEITDTTGKMTAMLVGEAYEANYRMMNSPVLYLKGRPQGSHFMIDKCKIPGKSGKK
jgi:DNA polymerase-3 subunit alpha